MLNLTLNRDYFDRDHKNPGIPESGIAADELAENLRHFLAGKHFSSTLQEHVAAFHWLLENCRIGVSPEDLFVTTGLWDRKPIRDVLRWNRIGHVRQEYCKDTEKMRSDFENAKYGFFTWDYYHSVPDWQAILELGFSGLLKRAKQAEIDFKAKHNGVISEAEQEFFDAVKSEYSDVLVFLDRVLLWAEKAKCQPQTIEALSNLRKGAAGSFYEAMLQIWLFYQLSEYGDCVQTRSFGNLDVALIGYYRNDLASGRFTEEEIRAVVRNFFCKVTAMGYPWGHPFYMGGTLPDGSSAFNELSTLLLDEYGKLGIYDPKIQIKLAPNTPQKYIDQALNLIRTGRNSIVFVGEPCIERTMLRYGYSREEARTAVIKGCYEYCVQGKSVETAGCTLNMPRLLMDLLRQNSGAASFEELFEKCCAGFEAVADDIIAVENDFEKYLTYANPAPLFSGASPTALLRGVDGYGKGAQYNNSNIWFAGPVTAGNSLAMVKKYVYDLHEITLPELLKVLDDNWHGAEVLQLKIRQDADQFGNNRPADAVTVTFLERLAEHINFTPNSRGGIYTTALHSADAFIPFGREMGATPDGRSAGEEFTKNASVRSGSNFNGVTAVIGSVLKLDPAKFMADFPLDIMLHPSAVAGEEGLLAMRSLLMTYIKKGGHAVHFNVFSSDMLKDAQLHPEKYRDLQVRICGWNVLWNNLNTEEQNSYLEQAKANEELC
ncbi:MAG: hypothetical protein IJW17_04935 [Lentisphaeria bacterium]|nr:hypothetical protein [Lentisphaeria bacterium]